MTENSTSSLERDAERVRAEIADTADHLKAKMSPGQLMDEIVAYFKDGDANQFVSNLKHQVRDNPLALALVGGGLAWLMMGSGTGHAGAGTPVSRAQTPAPLATGPVSHQVRSRGNVAQGDHGSGIGESAAHARDAAASAAHRVGDAASSATASASGALSSAADAASRSLHDLRDGVSEQMANASHAGIEIGERVKSSFLETLEREPLVIGALGLAVGAAMGAMMPMTRAEQETIGETSQKLRDEAKSALSTGVEKAKDVAGEAYEAAREEADRQGLTPRGKPVTAKIADVVGAAGTKARQGAHRVMDEAERKVERKTDNLKPGPKRN